jgi:thioredoxin 1
MDGNPNLFTVSDQDFAAQVLQSELPVVVDFTAAWCPPCHALNPVYAKLSQAYAGRLRFAKMDVDENPRTTAQQGVQGMPTLVLFANGRPVGRLVGPHPARLQQGIERLLAQIGVAA